MLLNPILDPEHLQGNQNKRASSLVSLVMPEWSARGPFVITQKPTTWVNGSLVPVCGSEAYATCSPGGPGLLMVGREA